MPMLLLQVHQRSQAAPDSVHRCPCVCPLVAQLEVRRVSNAEWDVGQGSF